MDVEIFVQAISTEQDCSDYHLSLGARIDYVDIVDRPGCKYNEITVFCVCMVMRKMVDVSIANSRTPLPLQLIPTGAEALKMSLAFGFVA